MCVDLRLRGVLLLAVGDRMFLRMKGLKGLLLGKGGGLSYGEGVVSVKAVLLGFIKPKI
jgi:hypothetical protein